MVLWQQHPSEGGGLLIRSPTNTLASWKSILKFLVDAVVVAVLNLFRVSTFWVASLRGAFTLRVAGITSLSRHLARKVAKLPSEQFCAFSCDV